MNWEIVLNTIYRCRGVSVTLAPFMQISRFTYLYFMIIYSIFAFIHQKADSNNRKIFAFHFIIFTCLFMGNWK